MRKHSLPITMFAIAFLLFVACNNKPCPPAEAGPNMDSIRALIGAMEQEYAAAENAKDAERLYKYYADDAIVMPNGKTAWVGHEQIKAGLQADMDSMKAGTKVSFMNTGLWAQGNIVVETGATTWTDSTGATVNTGKYMTLYEKRNGKYIAIRDIWNDDK